MMIFDMPRSPPQTDRSNCLKGMIIVGPARNSVALSPVSQAGAVIKRHSFSSLNEGCFKAGAMLRTSRAHMAPASLIIAFRFDTKSLSFLNL